MIKIENVEIYGWEAAIRGMRNPMNSWDRSDSTFEGGLNIGENDLKLMKNLVRSGSDHSKFMRMIAVTLDITAPRYWWTELDTYKVGTVRNSCSTMHKIHEKEFTLDDFSHEHLSSGNVDLLCNIIDRLNIEREAYLKTGLYNEMRKHMWWQMIQLLPQSYNQRATVQLNYAVLKNMYHSRKEHKLNEWRDFCKWIETLPYAELITSNFNGDI